MKELAAIVGITIAAKRPSTRAKALTGTPPIHPSMETEGKQARHVTNRHATHGASLP